MSNVLDDLAENAARECATRPHMLNLWVEDNCSILTTPARTYIKRKARELLAGEHPADVGRDAENMEDFR